MGLASTTSFSGFSKIGKNGVLSETTALHRGPNLIGERRKQISFDFEWKRFTDSRKVKPDNFPVPRDDDRLFLFKQACRAITKLSDGCGFHVTTIVGIVWHRDIFDVKSFYGCAILQLCPVPKSTLSGTDNPSFFPVASISCFTSRFASSNSFSGVSKINSSWTCKIIFVCGIS